MSAKVRRKQKAELLEQMREWVAELRQRVTGEEEVENLFLGCQLLRVRPVGSFRQVSARCPTTEFISLKGWEDCLVCGLQPRLF